MMVSHKRKRKFAGRNGVATVEMAMVAPVIFALIFGGIEFSRMMMVRQALTNAARTGGREACLVTTRDDDRVEKAVRDSLHGTISHASDSESIRIAIDPPMSAELGSGTEITVTVEVSSSDISLLPPFFTANTVIRSTSTMRKE